MQVTAPDRAVARLQLEAQLQYRLGSPKEAIRSYSQLFQAHGVEGMEVRGLLLGCPHWVKGQAMDAVCYIDCPITLLQQHGVDGME